MSVKCLPKITDLIPVGLLEHLQESYMNYLQTSAAMYELDGTSAASLITSNYCNKLANVSETKAGKGKGLCHESCWHISKRSIDLKKPYEQECPGGLILYSVPIMFEGTPIGAVNAAVSNPIRSAENIKEIAEDYDISLENMQKIVDNHDDLPEFLLSAAKKQLQIVSGTIAALYKSFYELRNKSDELIKENSERKYAEDKIREYSETLEEKVKERTGKLEEKNLELKENATEIARKNAVLDSINKVFREAITCKTEEDLGKTCLAVAEELTGSKFGFIGELNREGLFDTIAISNPGWDACNMAVTDAMKRTSSMPIRGVDRSLLREGASRILNGEETILVHPDHIEKPEGHPPITAFLGVPLKREGKTIGMICLGNKEGGYDVADQEATEALSTAIVEALRSKRAEAEVLELSKNLKQHTAQLEVANEKLKEKNKELEHFNELFVGREFRIKDLKERIKELEKKIRTDTDGNTD